MRRKGRSLATASSASFANCKSRSGPRDAGTLSGFSENSSPQGCDVLLGFQSIGFGVLKSTEDFAFVMVVYAAGILRVHHKDGLKLQGKLYRARIMYLKHIQSIYL